MALTKDAVLARLKAQRDAQQKAQAAKPKEGARAEGEEQTDKQKRAPFVIRKGSRDAARLKFLVSIATNPDTKKVEKNPFDLSEIAAMPEFDMEVTSARSQLSKLKGALERANVPDDYIAAIMPHDMGTGGQGRAESPPLATDDLLAIFGGAEAAAPEGDDNEQE
jgi:hypothetical protein